MFEQYVPPSCRRQATTTPDLVKPNAAVAGDVALQKGLPRGESHAQAQAARRESFTDAVSPVPRKLLWRRQQLLLRGDGDK
jgi:hypothetical protein